MSSKSAVKLVVPEDAPGALFKWVAILTGSKNALKGVGFFLGGLLLTVARLPDGAAAARRRWSSAALVRHRAADARRASAAPDAKAKFRHMFSNNRAVNVLSAARFFLFASRDIWFVVGLPGLPAHASSAGASGRSAAFLAVWVIGYGIVQASAPRLRARAQRAGTAPRRPHGRAARVRARGVPGRDRRRARRRRRPDVGASSSGLIAVRRRVRAQLGRALVPDPRLRRRRQGRDERRLLLHGQRRRPPRRHRALGRCSTSGRASRRACGRRSRSCSPRALLSLLLPGEGRERYAAPAMSR